MSVPYNDERRACVLCKSAERKEIDGYSATSARLERQTEGEVGILIVQRARIEYASVVFGWKLK